MNADDKLFVRRYGGRWLRGKRVGGGRLQMRAFCLWLVALSKGCSVAGGAEMGFWLRVDNVAMSLGKDIPTRHRALFVASCC
jgi:hypothetical protein